MADRAHRRWTNGHSSATDWIRTPTARAGLDGGHSSRSLSNPNENGGCRDRQHDRRQQGREKLRGDQTAGEKNSREDDAELPDLAEADAQLPMPDVVQAGEPAQTGGRKGFGERGPG